MAEHPLELVDGHLFVDMARLLLDTGSPVSFSTTGRASWGGRTHELPTGALGLDAEELSRLVGEPLDGLLGGDLLSLRAFTIDLERRRCAVEELESDRDRTELRLRLVLGVPLATIDVDGAPTETCIDTGAKLSYLDAARLEGHIPLEEADDFYPGYGRFRTRVYEIPVRVGDAELSMRVGSLPEALSEMLGMFGIAAILGTDLFERFPVVTFDYPASRILLAGSPTPGKHGTARATDRELD